jgi:3-oxoacyl-[acyl-carrier-protein] synthase II
MGVVTPVGNDVETFWSSVCAGKSGIGPLTAFDASGFQSRIAGEVKNIDFTAYVDPKEARRTDRYILFAIAAATMAIRDAGLDLKAEDLSRCGTIIGSGIGGLKTLEDDHRKLVTRGPDRVSPFLIPMMICDMAAGMVSIRFGFTGPNYAVVSACASGAHAIGDAWMCIKSGRMDVAIAGGAEATVTPLAVAGFCNMKALSLRNDEPQRASRPFDKNRDGFVIGEGAGLLVLESLEHALARKATIHAEIVGFGCSGDAYHIAAPHPEGKGAQTAMNMALKTARLEPSAIGYVNAHGTSTPDGDKAESLAIKSVFQDHIRNLHISSTKSMIGHLLGASGGVELIASILSVKHGIIHPTINFEEPDSECDLNYTPNMAVTKPVKYAMKNSFGFGGHNASLIVGKYDPSGASA